MAMAHGNLCRHGWVPSQPLLVIVSPFYPSPPLPSSFPPPYFSILLQLFWLSTTYTLTHTHHPPHTSSFSLQGSSGHCSPLYTPPPPLPFPSTHNTPPPTTTSSTPPHPLFLSERMFQPLHTDSSGILCVEMFLLDPQALTIYRTKARAPLLKALAPLTSSSHFRLVTVANFPLPSALRYGWARFKGVLSDTTLTVVKVNAMQYMLWLVNNTKINK